MAKKKKYLICSDIHGRLNLFEEMLSRESNIDAVIIAGDLELETYELTDAVNRRFPDGCRIYMVAGNCDAWTPSARLLVTADSFDVSETHKVFLTHVHKYRASIDLMHYAAQEKGADIVIYGHTHYVHNELIDGITFLNPGALMSRFYMVMTIGEDETIAAESKYIS